MKTFNIISYGESLSWFYEYENPEAGEPGHQPVIGVNHVGRYFTVDQLLLIDHPAHFTPQKIADIRQTDSEKFLIVHEAWQAYLPEREFQYIKFCNERSSLKTLEDKAGIHENLPFSYNSPFVATCIALRSGATTLNFFGVDFNTSSDAGSELNEKNIRDFRRLHMYVNLLGIQMFTTPESKLSQFMSINPLLKSKPIKAF